MKKHKIIPTKEQFEILKKGWSLFQGIDDRYYRSITDLERWLSKKTGIEEIEFIHDSMCMGWSGIGNGTRELKLLQREDLE